MAVAVGKKKKDALFVVDSDEFKNVRRKIAGDGENTSNTDGHRT